MNNPIKLHSKNLATINKATLKQCQEWQDGGVLPGDDPYAFVIRANAIDAETLEFSRVCVLQTDSRFPDVYYHFRVCVFKKGQVGINYLGKSSFPCL